MPGQNDKGGSRKNVKKLVRETRDMLVKAGVRQKVIDSFVYLSNTEQSSAVIRMCMDLRASLHAGLCPRPAVTRQQPSSDPVVARPLPSPKPPPVPAPQPPPPLPPPVGFVPSQDPIVDCRAVHFDACLKCSPAQFLSCCCGDEENHL